MERIPLTPVGTAGDIPVIPTDMAEGGKTADFLRAENGFSALVEVRVDNRNRRVLFDTGVSPDGLVANLEISRRSGWARDVW